MIAPLRECGTITARTARGGTRWHLRARLRLQLRLLSPLQHRHREKLLTYQQARVPEYWIVDYRARTIEVRVMEGGRYTLLEEFRSGEAARSQVLTGFEIAVDDLFEM